MSRPELTLSLQFADASHRAELPRHKVARWIRAALQHPAEIAVRIVDAEEGRRLNPAHGTFSSSSPAKTRTSTMVSAP